MKNLFCSAPPVISRLALVFLLFSCGALCPRASAQGVTGSIKGTVSATAGDASARPELLPGARLTLVNRDLAGRTFTTVSDDAGNFAFLDLPAATSILTAEAGGLPRATREIRLTT